MLLVSLFFLLSNFSSYEIYSFSYLRLLKYIMKIRKIAFLNLINLCSGLIYIIFNYSYSYDNKLKNVRILQLIQVIIIIKTHCIL